MNLFITCILYNHKSSKSKKFSNQRCDMTTEAKGGSGEKGPWAKEHAGGL